MSYIAHTTSAPPLGDNPYLCPESKLTAWERLIERYADGRKPCNCRQAYALPGGGYAHGCQANQGIAKDEIAARIEADLTK